MTAPTAKKLDGDDTVPELTLTVGGKRYGGWIGAQIERDLDRFTPTFSLSYTDTWAPHQIPWPIRTGNECELHFGEHLLLTGYVNGVDWLVDGENWSLSATGRSVAGDLEDCSAIHESGHWQNFSILKIAQALVEDYGITVTSTAADALLPLKRFALQEGETVQEAIARLCEEAALLPVTHADGSIELVRGDFPRAKTIVFPTDEAIQRRVSTNDQQRHSNYYAIGQSRGDKNRAGLAVVRQKEGIADTDVTRHRPLVVVVERAVNQAEQLRARATWERNMRAGRSMRYLATVMGVLSPNGQPWTPGWRIEVEDAPMGVDDSLILVRTEVRASATELITELEMTFPEAYSALEIPPRKKLNPNAPRPPKAPQLCFSPDQLEAMGVDTSKVGL